MIIDRMGAFSPASDGPRGLLRRMRSQLAEDGDAESQLVLARALLDSSTQVTTDGEYTDSSARVPTTH